MGDFLSQALGTLTLRPYVFIFLVVYLIGCSLHLGVKRAVLFLPAGYLIAWLSEYSSIHNGIPYGLYYYVESTVGREIWIGGVPLMDSLSYVFLAYASYSTALMAISPVYCSGGEVCVLETRRLRGSLVTTALASTLFVYLDIIIDPVALKGQKWFLGRIYGYPDGGAYFGVPISNFTGWFIVGFIMIYVLQKVDAYLFFRGTADYSSARSPLRHLIGPLLYAGVAVFNLTITFFIGEYTMAWAGVFIALLPSILFFLSMKRKTSAVTAAQVQAHLKDFPSSWRPMHLFGREGEGEGESALVARKQLHKPTETP